MGIPWYILALPILVQSVLGITLETGDSDSELIYNFTATDVNQYEMYFEEDNHVNDSDNLRLFYINDVTSKPSCVFLTPDTFQYNISPISDSRYEFNTTQYFDYETQANQYNIKCSDDNSIFAILLLTIVNIDDEPPTLTSPMCSMMENTDYNQENTTCTCTLSDPDGWLSQTSFTVINSNSKPGSDLNMEDKLFHFDFDRTIADNVYTTPVFITTKRPLDYEIKIFYSFSVQAMDGANHSTTPKKDVTCIIDVEDLNDMPPTWTDYFTTQQIQEEQPYNFNVTAVDGDKGINSPIYYSLISSYPEEVCGADPCVSISTEDGKGIIKVLAIDRDALDLTTYEFTLMAQEHDDPPFTANITITFYINDIDDNSPLVKSLITDNSTNLNYTEDEPKVAEFTFYENFAGTIDGKINIQDIDTGVNAQFNVILMEDDTKTGEIKYTNAFIIVPTAGYRKGDFQISVKNATYLDFEDPPWQNIQFYVHSYGTEDSSKEDKLLIKITLLDYNDEVPKFEKSAYSVSVNETIKKGEEIIQVKATDRDAEDKVLTHRIIAADAILKTLDIDSAEGIITVAIDNAFDYDRLNPIIFQVEAVDHAAHVTTVPVTVNLLDINNKAPTYSVEDVIRVDENQAIGIPLNATITASDVDTTRNLTAEIDWDKSYATKNSQRLNTSIPLIQRAMQFLELSFEKISEDTISITLQISNNNENNTSPDYETFDTLYLDVRITDLNTELPEFADKMSIDAIIVININDINDNAPIFTEETLKKVRSVYERSNAETIVGNIEATDADIGDIVTYSCKYITEKYDWFTCSSEGILTVTTTGEIDCDTDKLYIVNISCEATDGLHITPQEFPINIKDRNNKYPQIEVNNTSPSASVVEVYEKSNQSTVVTNVGYTDQDRDEPFRTATCSFQDSETECYEQFVIKNNEVVVKNAGKQLDRDEGTKEYVCTVYCVDNPRNEEEEPQNTNKTEFIIKLLDINDHCPELQIFEFTASETTKKDELIGEVIAKDIDEGLNAEIDISILTVTKDDNTEYTNEALFRIIKTDDYKVNDTLKRWHLAAHKDLRDFYGEYTIQLELKDKGTPIQSTEDDANEKLKEISKLKVTISKYNFNAPKFVFPNNENSILVLSSVQVAGTQLAMFLNSEMLPDINITTGEDDQCIDKWDPAFDISLTGSSSELVNFFIIKNVSRCTAQLQVDQSFKKGQLTYEAILTTKLSEDASDGTGEVPYSESINLKISFADPDGDPIFDNSLGTWNFSMPEDNITAMEELPNERKAYYPNVNITFSVYYSLYTDNKDVANTFDVELNTGNVMLKRKLDYLEATNYEFQILASKQQNVEPNFDGLSLLPVTIVVEDVNNHVPQWTQDTFFGAIMKSSQKGVTILTASATDLDVIDQDKLKYTFNSTIDRTGSDSIFNIQDPFLLDESTGDIKLNFQIEANMDGHFFFSLCVEDAQDRFGNGPNYNSSTIVTIYIVTEDNTLTFKFENKLDEVVANKQEVTKSISDALGWDCHDYSIDRDSQNGVVLDNVTVCNIYCVVNNTLLTTSDIKTKLNNINTFKAMRQGLLKYGVLLLNFDSDATTGENLETTLKAVLIGVSVVLGALCVILAITFFLKARELNRRLKRLTEQKFGSDESNINRKGVNAPNTNVFAVEGSNPVFSNEIKRDDFTDYDKKSIDSGDSDLIGVEDSPEFDSIFTVEGANPRFS